MEQVTEYNNVTREVKIQVRILRELEDHGGQTTGKMFREFEVHGAGHRIQQCHTGGQNTGQNV